jgi:carboxypeptidase family protein
MQAPAQAGGGQAPARDNQTKPGTATIRGRVIGADNGQPLRKAQVRIVSPDVRENRLATTDADGQYEVKELPAGRYNVTASKGSFVSLAFGQLRPFESGKPLDIRDGQTIEKVNFALPRGSVITGHVLDDYGDPASDVMVQVTRYQYIQGQRRLVPAGRGAVTDDIGGFRLFGLSPGQYYLSATLRPGSDQVLGPGRLAAWSGPTRMTEAATLPPTIRERRTSPRRNALRSTSVRPSAISR